jgi:DNA repair protein RadC
MNSSMLTASETAVVDRAQTWVPKNIRDLARVDPKAAKNLLAEVYTELFANEGPSETAIDPEDLVPELQAAIGIRSDECFAAVFLDHGRRIVGRKVYPQGSRTRSVLYPRQLFKDALAFDATGIVLSHNHPGGTLAPSLQDRELTRRVQTIGESLEITLVDHIIVTETGHASFRSHGWM